MDSSKARDSDSTPDLGFGSSRATNDAGLEKEAAPARVTPTLFGAAPFTQLLRYSSSNAASFPPLLMTSLLNYPFLNAAP